MGLKDQKAAMQRELNKFLDLLDGMLPRYSALLKQNSLTEEELNELGDLEHFLFQVTAQITDLKERLEQAVFGHSLDLYYKTKQLALLGDEDAKKKMHKLRDNFHDSLKNGNLILWN